MEDNKTEALNEQENSLDSRKPQILAMLLEHIEKNMSEKTKKKNLKFVEQILSAGVDQISFGKSPTYETGYVYGNVTAEGSRDIGDTRYTNTITLDLQTPEYVFFNINHDDSLRYAYKLAFLEFGLNRFLFSAKKSIFSQKRESKVYVSDYEDEALQDYATIICEEQLARLNYSIDECRVNDYDFIETQETKDSHIYPVFLTLKDKKGKDVNVPIGHYHADKDKMYFKIDFGNVTATDVIYVILGAIVILPIAIAAIAAIVGVIALIIKLITG